MKGRAVRRMFCQSPLILTANTVFRQAPPCLRQFSKSARRRDEDDSTSYKPPAPAASPPTPSLTTPSLSSFRPPDTQRQLQNAPAPVSSSLHPKSSFMTDLTSIMDQNAADRLLRPRRSYPQLQFDDHTLQNKEADAKVGGKLWHLHIYANKHNTHITLTQPNHNPVISLSCGNLGFRHSARKNFDAGWQLANYTLGKIQEKGFLGRIRELELCLRGFGKGREAVTKVLMGAEGRALRAKVVKVSDSTKLKFGGTRSKNIRRL